jgi:hypothetical protein
MELANVAKKFVTFFSPQRQILGHELRNSGQEVTREPRFCLVNPTVCVFAAGNLPYVTFLAPEF